MSEIVEQGHYAYRNRLGKRFALEDRVVIHSMPAGCELEEMGGVIVGLSSDHIAAFYIVLLDHPLADGQRAVNMIESCLDHPTIELRAHDAA